MMWLTVCAACFFGGIRVEREIERRRLYTSDLEIPFRQGPFGGGVTCQTSSPDHISQLLRAWNEYFS